MAQPYSERFFSAFGLGWHSFVVPAGKRAVLMTLVTNNVGGTAAFFQLHIGALLLYTTIPANGSTLMTALRMVAYGGENISVYLSTDNCGCGGFGYLFDESGGRMPLEPVDVDPSLPPGAFVE